MLDSETSEVVGPESSGDRLPEVRCWDPDHEPAPGLDSISVELSRCGSAMLLVAGAGARGDGWAQRAAVGLARGLSGRGPRVVLADLDFAEPALHACLGEPNGEGIADVFDFGASPERVTLTWSARPFGIIPAGAYVADPRGVLEHAAWTRLLARSEAAGDLLIAFAPAGAPGLDTLARKFRAVTVLGVEAECAEVEATLPAGVRVLAAFAPAVQAASTETVAALVHPRPIVGGPPEGEAVSIDERTFAVRELPRPAPRRRVSFRILTLVAVLLLSVLVGMWHIGRRLAPADRVSAAPPPVAAPGPAATVAPAGGGLAGEPLPYSVTIEIHDDMAVAARRVESLESLARGAPGIGFFVAPILVDGAVAYRILAGPVRDSASAERAMEWLIENGHTTGRSEWSIRARPYAFLLGEYETREAAEQHKVQLGERRIPTYIIEAPYADASHYYLYAGAYSGAAEADVMRQLLRDEGLADSLVERTGRSSR